MAQTMPPDRDAPPPPFTIPEPAPRRRGRRLDGVAALASLCEPGPMPEPELPLDPEPRRQPRRVVVPVRQARPPRLTERQREERRRARQRDASAAYRERIRAKARPDWRRVDAAVAEAVSHCLNRTGGVARMAREDFGLSVKAIFGAAVRSLLNRHEDDYDEAQVRAAVSERLGVRDEHREPYDVLSLEPGVDYVIRANTKANRRRGTADSERCDLPLLDGLH